MLEQAGFVEVAMTSHKTAARTVGILVVLHLLLGLMVPFIILDFVRGTRGFLLVTPDHANQLRLAVFLLFIGSAMATAISVAAFPVIRRYSSAWALWLVALAVAAFSLQVVDNGRLLTMLSLSQHYADSGFANPELYQEFAFLAGSARRWAHYTYLFVAVCWILLLFATLFRLRLVPRSLTAVGMLCAMMQIGAVSVRAMLGHAPEMRLAVPLGPVYLALALWLIVKGFREEPVAVASTNHYPLSTGLL
jgi:Domain of unknown function (DUF4386)